MVDPLRGLLAELVTITLVSVRSSGTLSDHADLIDCFYAMLSQVHTQGHRVTGSHGNMDLFYESKIMAICKQALKIFQLSVKVLVSISTTQCQRTLGVLYYQSLLLQRS